MAQAPRPGVAKRKAAQEQARKVLRITVAGVTVELAPDNVSFKEQIEVRKACGGLPLSAFWGDGPTVGVDSLQVLFWLGRRACGEPGLPLSTVLEEWPQTLSPELFEVVVVEPDEADDYPES
jgi:hypothetical protein